MATALSGPGLTGSLSAVLSDLFASLPTMTRTEWDLLLRSRKDGAFAIVKVTKYTRAHLELGNILRAAFPIVSMPPGHGRLQVLHSAPEHEYELCRYRIKEAWKALDAFTLQASDRSLGISVNAFLPLDAIVSKWRDTFMYDSSAIMHVSIAEGRSCEPK